MEISSKKNIIPELSEAEEALIDRMFNLLGPRWALIAGRIPGRTSEEIEHYSTSRNSLDAKKKLLPEVKELIPDSMSTKEDEGNMSDNRLPHKISIGSYAPEFKPVLEKIGTSLAGHYKTDAHVLAMQKKIIQPAAADQENETQLVKRSGKRIFITEHVEPSSRKVARQTIFLNQSDIVSGTKSTDVAQRVRVLAHRVTARKLMLRHNNDVLKNEKERLSEDKGQLLVDVEGEKAAKAEAAKTVVMDIKDNHKEKLANMQRKLSDLFKFVGAHAEECAHFAVKLKEWTG